MKIVKKKTVGFVGSHNLSPKHVSDRNLENIIRTELYYVIEEFYKEGKTTFLSGLRNKFEVLATEAVLEYAQMYKGIRLYVVLSLESEADDSKGRQRLFEAVTGRLVIPEEMIDDFLIESCSEVVVYGNEPDVIRVMDRAERENVEVWNMYDELEGYFSIENPVKAFLQDYPEVISFRYGREGLIFQGYQQPFPVAFAEIAQVEKQNDLLCFKLWNGLVIMASLFSDACYVKRPPFSRIKPENLS